MEAHQQNQTSHHHEDMTNGVAKLSTSSYLCRQSSTRWTPTTEQIKLLKELYYINGVRSPSADQIQAICSKLRRYGKIEGKNVFYWFQNHKARERQKKRIIPNTVNNAAAPQFLNHNNAVLRNGGLHHWKQDADQYTVHNKYPNINNSGIVCSSSSAGIVPGGGQLVGNYGYGAVSMENKFRENSISAGFHHGGNVNNNFQWGAGNYNPYVPPTYSNLLDRLSAMDEDHDQDYDDEAPEIETLPLFPMRDEDHHDHQLSSAGFYTMKPSSDGYYTGGYRWTNGNNGSASLELSLNSYAYGYYSPNI